MTMLDRLLERANAEGRTAERCRHCGQAIDRAVTHSGPLWVTQDGGVGHCPAVPVRDAWPPRPHEPVSRL